MKPATEILLSAAFVLTPEENWTQGMWESRLDGQCQFCADGAMRATRRQCGYRFNAYGQAQDYFYAATGAGVIHFNDTHSHAEVLDALYRAAEIAESQ